MNFDKVEKWLKDNADDLSDDEKEKLEKKLKGEE